MRVQQALEQLDAIHEHLAKAEVYRGFKVRSVALVGVLGLLAAAVQERIAGDDPRSFVVFWIVVASLGGLVGFGAAAQAYFFYEDEFARRKTRRVLAQFLPCVAVGGLITAALIRGGPAHIALLPGIWAIVFGLGMIAARPYLPRGIGQVGLAYVLIGSLLLIEESPSPWSVGGVFGGGHLLTAFVLWLDRPRCSDG